MVLKTSALKRSEGAAVHFILGGVEHRLSAVSFQSRFEVDNVIRLQAVDFDLIPEGPQTLVHFNLGTVWNELSLRYALMPIVKPGRRFEDGSEILPMVDASRVRVGTCVEVIRSIHINQVTRDQFAHSLSNIRNGIELERALVRRYKGVFPNLSVDEIPAHGCTLTRLTLS